MKKIIYCSFILLIISLWASCDKSTPTPTPIDPKTTVHIDTVRCKINGKDWEAVPVKLNGQPFTNAVSAELLTGPLLNGDTVFYIVAFQLDKDKYPIEDLNFSFWAKDNSNRYLIGGGSGYSSNCANYKIDTLLNRPVIVNYHDRKKGIIKGRFAFTAISTAPIKPCKDTVIITDGYFSVRY